MSKCAGNIPEFDDLEDSEEVERRRTRWHRRQRGRKRPARAGGPRARVLGW